MFRGYRSIILAFGLALAFAAIWSGTQEAAIWADSPSPYPKYYETVEQTQERLPALPTEQTLKRPLQQQPCRNQQSRDASDLCAQWRAANAAERASRWAWWQMIFSFFGILGLGATLWFNFRAVSLAEASARIAEEATEDADRALDIAERSADASVKATEAMNKQTKLMADAQRPWLDFDIEVTGISKYAGDRPRGSDLSITVHVTNYSKYPAHRTVAAAKGFYGNGLVSLIAQGEQKKWIKTFLDEQKREKLGDVVFPGKPSALLTFAEISISGEQDSSAAALQTVTLCVGLRYTFDGGDGYTERTFFLIGLKQFIAAALRGEDLPSLSILPAHNDTVAT